MGEENNGFAGINVTEPSTWQSTVRINNNGTIDIKCKVNGELRDIYTPPLKFNDSISIYDMEISDDGCPRYGVAPIMKGWRGQ